MIEEQVALIASITTAAGVIVAAAALIVNVFQLREQSRFNKLTHKLHVYANLHENYMRLSTRRNESVRQGNRDDVEQIYREYFSRHFDHWDFYNNGIHDEANLVDWLYSVFDVMRGWYDLGYARSNYIWGAVGRNVVRTNVRLLFVLESIAALAGTFDSGSLAPGAEVEVRVKLREFLRRAVATKDESILLVEVEKLKASPI